jgi:hypothetical protein
MPCTRSKALSVEQALPVQGCAGAVACIIAQKGLNRHVRIQKYGRMGVPACWQSVGLHNQRRIDSWSCLSPSTPFRTGYFKKYRHLLFGKGKKLKRGLHPSFRRPVLKTVGMKEETGPVLFPSLRSFLFCHSREACPVPDTGAGIQYLNRYSFPACESSPFSPRQLTENYQLTTTNQCPNLKPFRISIFEFRASFFSHLLLLSCGFDF